MYPPHDELARAYQAALQQEAAQHRMAEQVRTAPQVPPQARGDTLLDWGSSYSRVSAPSSWPDRRARRTHWHRRTAQHTNNERGYLRTPLAAHDRKDGYR